MRRLALGALTCCGVLALWVSLARSQGNPWWNPINPYGQSEGVTYGTELPTLVNTGSRPGEGQLAVLITPRDTPTFNMFDWSTEDWWSFLQQREDVPAGESGDLINVSIELNAMDGNDTVRGLHLQVTNADHTGANNFFSTIEVGAGPAGFVADAQATEVGININDGFDTQIRMLGDGRVVGVDSLEFWTDGAANVEIDEDGLFPLTVAFAALPPAANGAILFCSDCLQASPCAGVGNGALAVRINGAWECTH